MLIDEDHGIFAVADGMGGHAAGEVASGIAVRASAEVLLGDRGAGGGVPAPDVVEKAFRAAWAEIGRHARDEPATGGMGTTLTMCLLSTDGGCRIGHIGDSRAYRLREGLLEPLTRDHTWVRREVDAGRLEARGSEAHPYAHLLTRVLSADMSPAPDILAPSMLPGDLILLSSDGLHGEIGADELQSLVASGLPLADLVKALVDTAIREGGRDNITAIAIRILPAPQPFPQPRDRPEA
jgi:PPM family protein phosphatase